MPRHRYIPNSTPRRTDRRGARSLASLTGTHSRMPSPLLPFQ